MRKEEEVMRLHRLHQTTSRIARQLRLSEGDVEYIIKNYYLMQRLKMAGVLVLLIMAFLMGYTIYTQLKHNAKAGAVNTTPTTVNTFNGRAAVMPFITSAPGDVWELTSVMPDPGAIPPELDYAKKVIGQLDTALETYRDLPEVKDLYDRYHGQMRASIYLGGATRFSSRDPRELDVPFALEVSFCPRDSYGALVAKTGGMASFDPSIHALVVPAVRYRSRAWTDALWLHELYHAAQFDCHAVSSTAPPQSDEWVREELRAHDLERTILNRATGGQYDEVLQAIVVHLDAVSGPTIISQLTPEHIQRLDELFEPAGRAEAEVRAGEYLLDLAFTKVDMTEPDASKAFAIKIRVYRYITAHS